MHQAAKLAGAATLGGRRGNGCLTTLPILPGRMICGGCWMATPHQAAFAASTSARR
jgi:hypothetical protein